MRKKTLASYIFKLNFTNTSIFKKNKPLGIINNKKGKRYKAAMVKATIVHPVLRAYFLYLRTSKFCL